MKKILITTPKNLDKYVAKDVTIITIIILVATFFS